ncbi:type II asparaginase [Pistricoccus aurantiacus]|uniref:Type II asparaginase n=1 Tax=Pistricoccus aurantiacus TaxID=1883414 RepID=A0A5B8SRS9_9GAMM|nr:type II asparaginase [Pistricoccus aurantiacus]QEA37803.1 type II asparaginase [Pistricoccus aurantiacus]
MNVSLFPRLALFTGCVALVLSIDALAADLPSIKIMATGGTIAGRGASATEAGYEASEVAVDELIQNVPEISDIADVSGEQVLQTSSQHITPEDWLTIGKAVNQAVADDGVDGVVITHGTDTMEETAYFLHLTVPSDKPVVLVGSMRPGTAMSADGAMNLFNAVALAGAPEARGKGVLLTLNETVFGARDVTKGNTTNPATFEARNAGPMGSVFFGEVNLYEAPIQAHTAESEFKIDELESLPQVDILYGYAGDSSHLVEAAVTSGAEGIVFAGVGNGNFHPEVEAALAKAREEEVAVVRSARVGSGHVTLDAEVDDEKYGFVVADDLSPQKARVLLTLALTETSEPARLQEIFFKY